MKEKKKSTLNWILEWAGQKRGAYLWSVLLAIMNVIFKIIPYFLIGDVIRLFVNGQRDFSVYLYKVILIALSFATSELFHGSSNIHMGKILH